MFVTRNIPISCSAGAMKSRSGSFLRSLGQSQRWLSVGATSGPSARKGSVRGSTLARSWLDWVAAAGLFDGGQVAFLAELQERDHDHAGDEEGVCAVEGGPPAGVQVVGHAAVLGAVEDVGGGRQRVLEGKSVVVRVALGGRRLD